MNPEVGTELVNPVARTRTVFLATGASTGGGYVEIEATYPPDSAKPPLHQHPQQAERFEVRSGRLHAVVDGVERDVAPGEALDVPAGVPHRMWATADTDTVFVWRTTPALRTDHLFCDLWQAAADHEFAPDPLKAYEVTLRYPDEFCLC